MSFINELLTLFAVLFDNKKKIKIPTNKLDIAKELFAKVKAKFVDSSSKLNTIYQEENIDEK